MDASGVVGDIHDALVEEGRHLLSITRLARFFGFGSR
jgi:hypothetical protein